MNAELGCQPSPKIPRRALDAVQTTSRMLATSWQCKLVSAGNASLPIIFGETVSSTKAQTQPGPLTAPQQQHWQQLPILPSPLIPPWLHWPLSSAHPGTLIQQTLYSLPARLL
ncbi:hypothetical protein KEM48_006180 [Puccinia striiformis f. sp. tritici PST-130]|nr:hypothetical protein Pst134EB_025003 [Puccinia striiformis f. sp. tritici]KAI9619638.1 hypothetical protein KEM48_006180 [Puccinia striiformis f. sp. tritici PST-130]